VAYPSTARSRAKYQEERKKKRRRRCAENKPVYVESWRENTWRRKIKREKSLR